MKRLLFLLFLPFCASAADTSTQAICTGDYHVLRNGVEIFCADCVDPTGGRTNYTGDCAAPPPVDLSVIQRANVTYKTQGGSQTATNVDVTVFANIWGRAVPNQPIQQYPFVNGSTASIPVGAGKTLGPQLNVPFNPGTLGHTLKSNSYGSTGNKAFKAKVVPPAGSWATSVWPGCEQTGHFMSENATIFNFRIAASFLPDGTPVPPPDRNGNPVQPNRSACYYTPSSSVKVLLGWVSATDFGTMTITWY